MSVVWNFNKNGEGKEKKKDNSLEMNSFTPNAIILLPKEVKEEERLKQNCDIITQGLVYQDLQQEVLIFYTQQKVLQALTQE